MQARYLSGASATSFLVGLACYYAWALQLGSPGGMVMAAWFPLGFVAAWGAARAVLLVAYGTSTRPAASICAVAYLVGGGLAASTPHSWLEVVDFAGSAYLVMLVLGWLVGAGDLVLRVAAKSVPPEGLD